MVLADLGSRFGVQEARGILLTPELAQEELAEMIGSSRPMVSKLLGEMAERSMIACQGRRYILLRGSGLDIPARWLLPLMAKFPADRPSALRPAAHNSAAHNGEDQLGGRNLAGRTERTAGVH
jgi:hypothetical protein